MGDGAAIKQNRLTICLTWGFKHSNGKWDFRKITFRIFLIITILSSVIAVALSLTLQNTGSDDDDGSTPELLFSTETTTAITPFSVQLNGIIGAQGRSNIGFYFEFGSILDLTLSETDNKLILDNLIKLV